MFESDDPTMEMAEFQQRPVEAVAARFFMEAMQNDQKTKDQGCPIFDDVEFIEMQIPGDKDIRRRPVNQSDKERFPRQYRAFVKGQDQDAASGTPLVVWPALTRGEAETARQAGAKTVEQLSVMADGMCQALGAGWIVKRQKAKDWLAAAKDGAVLSKLRDELKERDEKIAAMERMLQEQAQAIQQIRLQTGAAVPSIPAFEAPKRRRKVQPLE